MWNRVILTIAAGIIIAGAAYVTIKDGPSASPETQIITSKAAGESHPARPSAENAEDRVLAEIEKEIQLVMSGEDLQQYALATPEPDEFTRELEAEAQTATATPYHISTIINLANTIVLDEKIQSKEPVSVDPAQAADVAVGDVVELPLPGTGSYRAVVSRVDLAANGETRWNGYLEGHASDYPVTFTIGQYASFATITTPQGTYSMETVNGDGWIYKNPDLADLVDPDQPDHLIVDQGNPVN